LSSIAVPTKVEIRNKIKNAIISKRNGQFEYPRGIAVDATGNV